MPSMPLPPLVWGLIDILISGFVIQSRFTIHVSAPPIDFPAKNGSFAYA